MRIYGEESFGPVVADRRRSTAPTRRCGWPTTRSTGCRRPCSAATSTPALQLARRIESGICHINASTVHDEPQMPFGGVKGSGWGRFGGRAALEEFTELRWMSVQQTPRHYPI